MNALLIYRIIGVILVCLGIRLGLPTTPGIIVFGVGLGLLFVPPSA